MLILLKGIHKEPGTVPSVPGIPYIFSGLSSAYHGVKTYSPYVPFLSAPA